MLAISPIFENKVEIVAQTHTHTSADTIVYYHN